MAHLADMTGRLLIALGDADPILLGEVTIPIVGDVLTADDGEKATIALRADTSGLEEILELLGTIEDGAVAVPKDKLDALRDALAHAEKVADTTRQDAAFDAIHEAATVLIEQVRS